MKTCCIDGCVSECEKGRHYCREHYLERKREQAKRRYEDSAYVRRSYTHECTACKKVFQTYRKTSTGVCPECIRNARSKIHNQVDNCSYKLSTRHGLDAWQHRVLAKNCYGGVIPTGYVVHHINGDKSNNYQDNLVLMQTGDHVRLHKTAIIEYAKVANTETYFDFMKRFFNAYVTQNNLSVIKLNS